MTRRDIKADYKAAYIAEYENCVRAGAKETAKRIADILKRDFGYEVAPPVQETAVPKGETEVRGKRGRRPAVKPSEQADESTVEAEADESDE